MSEEEKEAIESLKKLVQLRKNKRGEIKHDTCIYSTKDLEIILNLIQKKQTKIEKQDKIINEMAEHIVSSAIVDDTVCAIKFCEIEEDCTHEKMLKCTKQYFERKVEL